MNINSAFKDISKTKGIYYFKWDFAMNHFIILKYENFFCTGEWTQGHFTTEPYYILLYICI